MGALIAHTIVYSLMIYFTISVIKHLNAKKHQLSEKTQQMQRQMNTMLLIQVILSFYFILLKVLKYSFA